MSEKGSKVQLAEVPALDVCINRLDGILARSHNAIEGLELGLHRIKNLPVPTAPPGDLPDQTNVVERFNALLMVAEALENRIRTCLEHLNQIV